MAARGHARPQGSAQRGFALLALLALLTVGVLYFVVEHLDASAAQQRREEATAKALAQAKEGLIAFAASVDLSASGPRPGDLPCPDNWSSGHIKAGTSGSDVAALLPPCTSAAKRLGRLPWRTLGTDDLRDGSGERLWYAVSTNFKNNPRTGALNSDTLGTITVRDGAGNVMDDAAGTTGVVAVIIAPGASLARVDGLVQDRSAANYNVPAHYLDNIASEDNAGFSDGTADGFFAGPVRDATDPSLIIANDRIAVVTRGELMAAIEKRVAGEIIKCLTDYAADPSNGGRYPWAAAMGGFAASSFGDTAGALFGRFPDILCATAGDGITLPCDTPPAGTNPAMQNVWPPSCTATKNWFRDNWREQVFYALADAYKPGSGVPSCGVGTCLSVDGSASNKQVAVLVAGRTIPPKTRSDTGDPSEYLEAINKDAGTSYVSRSALAPAGFNDVVRYR